MAGPAGNDQAGVLELVEWRREIAELYAFVRHCTDPVDAWQHWRDVRERLFLTHPQSPIPGAERDAAHAPRYFEYDAELRVVADVAAGEGSAQLPGSVGSDFALAKVGTVTFSVHAQRLSLAVHWLTDYAGGILLTFRDATSGSDTYGAGRYLLDTAKGADLGSSADALVLDFNFAYQPSCSYDPRWSCPLAPRENWLPVPIRAGERI